MSNIKLVEASSHEEEFYLLLNSLKSKSVSGRARYIVDLQLHITSNGQKTANGHLKTYPTS